MEALDTRSAVGQLAEDLGWLEDHCRRQAELAPHAGNLRLASGLTRNVLGPFLENLPARPLHIAVVGGAGAGKSTVVNFLAGAVVAEANPQAGYTRHPTAYIPPGPAFDWPSFLGYLGPLQRISQEKPGNVDEDVYQVRRIPPAATAPGASTEIAADALADFVIWDCPDMTTWASTGYVNRLLEIAALADVIVYVASDERYNDEVPTQYLHLFVKAGKAVVVVLTKMREADAEPLAEHFKQEILGRLPKLPDGSKPAVPVLTFPQMPQAVRGDPGGAGARHRAQLLDQIRVQCESDVAARLRTVTSASKYLSIAGEGLLEVARRDLAEFDLWKSVVFAGKTEFEDRYRREYLAGEQFTRFDRYRDQLMDLLELPGAGQLVSNLFWVLRTPYRLTRDYVGKMISRPDVLNLPEQTVLQASLMSWLDRLQAEALRRTGAHPLWKQIAHGFDAGLTSQARDRYQQEVRGFELKENDELDRAGRALLGTIENNPAILYTLRGGKFALDLAVIGGIIIFTWSWFPSWWHLLLIPVGVSITHQLAELAARGATEAARNRVRNNREALVEAELTEPLAEWLSEWPASGGSSFERLQQVLRRVPETIRQLTERVNKKAALMRSGGSSSLPAAAPPPLPPARPGPPPLPKSHT